MKPYTKIVLRDLEIEVQVKGPAQVAEELEVSEATIRELAPKEANEYDKAEHPE